MENKIKKLQSVLKTDPSNFQARRELSILFADNGFNEEALSNLQYLVKYFPEDAEIHYNLGILHEKLKDYESAKISYKKAIEISPQEDFYYNLGEVLVNLQEWDEAISAFKTVLKSDSQDGNCYFNLGLCYFNREEINLATDNFQKAVEINPQDIFAHFYLGNIYQNNGLTNFAIESYRKVLSISPDYSWAYYNLASIAYKAGNLEEAKENLLKTIEYNFSDIEAYKLLTKICIKENEIEEIITILETGLQKEENGDLAYFLAQVYRHIGKGEEYIDSLEKALDNNLTLSYAKNMVKKELENALLKLKHDNFEEPQIEEYTEFTEDSGEIVDEAEDSEDEFFEDDITEDLEEEN